MKKKTAKGKVKQNTIQIILNGESVLFEGAISKKDLDKIIKIEKRAGDKIMLVHMRENAIGVIKLKGDL